MSVLFTVCSLSVQHVVNLWPSDSKQQQSPGHPEERREMQQSQFTPFE